MFRNVNVEVYILAASLLHSPPDRHMQYLLDLHPGIGLYRRNKTGDKLVVKKETAESICRAWTGYVATVMAGVGNAVAPFCVYGMKISEQESDWHPVDIGNGVFILPAHDDTTVPAVSNSREFKFRHKTIAIYCTPKLVRPIIPVSTEDDVFTITPYGRCGTRLKPGSEEAKRSLETIIESVVHMAKARIFPTDLKTGNFVYYERMYIRDNHRINDARFIDLDQFGSSNSGWKSCSFFNELAHIGRSDPDLFDNALSHPDIISVCMQAQSTLKRDPCTAVLEMHLLMRSIIALLNFQLQAGLEIPLELLVPMDREIHWKCYVGSAFFDECLVV